MLDQYPFLPLILIFVVAYFFYATPTNETPERRKKFADVLKKGDKIITKSGMHGKIVDLSDKDSSCVIETMAGRIKFDRSAISMEMSKKLNVAVEKKNDKKVL